MKLIKFLLSLSCSVSFVENELALFCHGCWSKLSTVQPVYSPGCLQSSRLQSMQVSTVQAVYRQGCLQSRPSTFQDVYSPGRLQSRQSTVQAVIFHYVYSPGRLQSRPSTVQAVYSRGATYSKKSTILYLNNLQFRPDGCSSFLHSDGCSSFYWRYPTLEVELHFCFYRWKLYLKFYYKNHRKW